MLHRIHTADPFRPLAFGPMDLFFDAMRAPTLRRVASPSRVVRNPGGALLREEDDRFVLSAELPGIAPEGLEITIAGTTRPVPMADIAERIVTFADHCQGWPR